MYQTKQWVCPQVRGDEVIIMAKKHPTPEKRIKEKCVVYYRGLGRELDEWQKDWRDGKEIKKETYERLQAKYYRMVDDTTKQCKSRKTLETDIRILRKQLNIPSPAKAPKTPSREKKNRQVHIRTDFYETLARVDIIELRELLEAITRAILKNEHGGIEEYQRVNEEHIEPIIKQVQEGGILEYFKPDAVEIHQIPKEISPNTSLDTFLKINEPEAKPEEMME